MIVSHQYLEIYILGNRYILTLLSAFCSNWGWCPFLLMEICLFEESYFFFFQIFSPAFIISLNCTMSLFAGSIFPNFSISLGISISFRTFMGGKLMIWHLCLAFQTHLVKANPLQCVVNNYINYPLYVQSSHHLFNITRK